MEARDLLKELLAEIALDERALARKRELADFLEQRINGVRSPIVFSTSVGKSAFLGSFADDPVIGTENLPSFASHMHRVPSIRTTRLPVVDPSTMPTHTSASSAIAAAVADFSGAAEFEVNDVAEVLARRGIKINKTHVSTVLGRLVERGLIEIVIRGAGSAPNRYRNVPPRTGDAPSDGAPADKGADDGSDLV